MLLVLWVALILNSILISKQVSYTNLKARTSLRNNRKTHSHTPLIHKLRNFRRQKRKKEKIIFRTADVDDWGYEDISEPVEYNYKEIWWTNNYPDPTVETRKPTKINVYHKDLTENTSKATIVDNHPTVISTTTVTERKKLRMPKNVTKLYTKKDLVSQTKVYKVYSRASSKAIKKTTQTERTSTDKPKGFFMPILTKNDNGQFSILANKTDVAVKRNENDSVIRGSIINNVFIEQDLDLGAYDFIVFNDDPAQGQTREPVVIEVIKTDNMAEAIKKLDPNKKFVLDPRLSPGLPHIVKDGIYRIEIPDPVTKKTYVNTSKETNFDKRASQNLQPPRPFAESALRDHNINAGNRQRPFRNIKRPRPGPFYNPKSFGQNGQPGPFYKPQNPSYDRQGPMYGTNNIGQNARGPFYNPQNPGYDRQGPFYNPQNFGYDRQGPKYGPNNLGQNEQGPIYNSQNLGYDRQRPNYGINNLGQNRQGPFYNPQNVGYNRQQPIYSTNNLTQNRQTPYYNPQNRQSPIRDPKSPTLNKEGIHNAQNTPHDIQGPSNSTNSPERDRKDPQDTVVDDPVPTTLRDAPKNLGDLLFGTPDPTVSPELIERTRSTFAPGEGPNKDLAPVHFAEPTIGPISPYVRHMLEDMAFLKAGYFSMFFARLFELVAMMDDDSLRKLLSQAQWEVEILIEKEHFLDQFGEPFVSYFVGFANAMAETPIDVAKSAAGMLHYTMVNRRDGLTQDINSVIDYIDSLYERHEGIELFSIAEDIKEFPRTPVTRIELYRRLSKALFQPVRRLAGTAQKQILFDSLNKVIENHIRPPAGVIARRQGKKIEKNFTFHYARLFGITKLNQPSKVKYEGSTRLYLKKKNVNNKKSTKRPLRKSSPRKSVKKMYARTKNQTLEKSKELIQEDNSVLKLKKFKKLTSKMTENNKDENSEIHHFKLEKVNKVASEINKTTYFIEPLSETTVKHVRFTIKDKQSYRPVDAIPKSMIFPQNNTQNDKIDKLKEIIAEQIVEAKAQNFISKSEQTNIARNDTSNDEEETKEGIKEILETETTTPEPLKASSVSKIKHKEKKTNHKHKKNIHFTKKEIRLLRHKYPKLYKIYLRYLKKKKHNRNHKKKTHKEPKKKNRHSKKKKKNKKHPNIRNIERHYDHLLKHYMLKRTHLNGRHYNSENDVSKECKHILSVNNSKELSYMYDSFRSIELEMSKDIDDNVMTVPNYAFVTPVNNYIIPGNVTTTKKWVHYPIDQKVLRASNQNFQVPNNRIYKNFASEDSIQFSGSMPVWDDKGKVNEVEQSSYSDEEYELKLNLNDAMRHDNFHFNPQRRSMNVTEDKKKLHSFSSYSSEEVVLKSNIYKAFKFNKHHSRANFSDIVRKPIDKDIKKAARRTEVKPVNEETSYSDEEDILKQKLKL